MFIIEIALQSLKNTSLIEFWLAAIIIHKCQVYVDLI